MAEREEPQEGAEGTEPSQTPQTPQAPASGDEPRSGAPLDEDAAWAEIVAAYGTEPDGPGGWPAAEDLPEEPAGPAAPGGRVVNAGIPVIPRAFVVKTPPMGPRDYPGVEDEDEGHFVPPEPPPLPAADVTTKFAWLAVLGGPALMLVYVLTGTDMPTWAMAVGVGGFLGGFATLIARMGDGDDEDDDPHGGAVV